MKSLGKIALLSGLAIALGTLAHIPQAQAQVVISVGIGPPPPRYVRMSPARPGWLWARGYWRWDGVRYVWMRGYWYRPRPGYVYDHPYWLHNGGRWIFHHAGWHPRHGYAHRIYPRRDRDRDDWRRQAPYAHHEWHGHEAYGRGRAVDHHPIQGVAHGRPHGHVSHGVRRHDEHHDHDHGHGHP